MIEACTAGRGCRLGARDRRPSFRRPASASGCGSCRRGTKLPDPTRRRRPARSRASPSAPALIRRRSCASPGSTSHVTRGRERARLWLRFRHPRDRRRESSAPAQSSASTSTSRHSRPRAPTRRPMQSLHATLARTVLQPGAFDIVVANILSNPLKLLAPALLARVAPGGSLVLSGVLERQADEVIAAYREADATLRPARLANRRRLGVPRGDARHDASVASTRDRSASVAPRRVGIDRHGARNQVPPMRRDVPRGRRPAEAARRPRALRTVPDGVRRHRQPGLCRRSGVDAVTPGGRVGARAGRQRGYRAHGPKTTARHASTCAGRRAHPRRTPERRRDPSDRKRKALGPATTLRIAPGARPGRNDFAGAATVTASRPLIVAPRD